MLLRCFFFSKNSRNVGTFSVYNFLAQKSSHVNFLTNLKSGQRGPHGIRIRSHFEDIEVILHNLGAILRPLGANLWPKTQNFRRLVM